MYAVVESSLIYHLILSEHRTLCGLWIVGELHLVRDRPKDRVLCHANEQRQKCSGYNAEERIGQNGLDYIHPEDQRRAQDILERSIDAPGVLMQLGHFSTARRCK